MRENRTYGSEGGAAQSNAPFLPLSTASLKKNRTTICQVFIYILHETLFYVFYLLGLQRCHPYGIYKMHLCIDNQRVVKQG